MKRLSSLVILFFLMTPVFCQGVMKDTVIGQGEHFFQPKKFDYHVTLGSQFTSISGFGSGLNTYVSPHVSYHVNKRLSIGAGISIIQTNYFKARSYFQNEQASYSNGNFTSAMVYVSGQYLVNDRLTISGSAYKQFPISRDPLPYNPFNPVSSKGIQGIDMNVGYRIGDHMYIQAGFRFSDGANPYYTDPFNRNPFINDGYGSQTGFGVPRW